MTPLLSPRLLRKVHRALVPLVILPFLITIATGTLFQIALLTGKAGDFYWLMDVHRGNFGPLQLEKIYPFFNALGLLTMVVTGGLLWWGSSRRR